jgi:hypothetical protein
MQSEKCKVGPFNLAARWPCSKGLSFAPDAEQQFCSVDQGIYGHLTYRNLASLAQERGDKAEAQRLWRAVLAECPGDAEALAKLEP